MEEILDIVDSSLNITGRMERSTAHRTCAPHRTFHCWIYDSMEKIIIFQMRGKNQVFPLMLDVTVGGHIISGETVEMASREIYEEIGIRIPFPDLRYMGRNTFTFMDNEKCILEIAEVHSYDIHGKNVIPKPDPRELLGLVSIPFETAALLLDGFIKEAECSIQLSPGDTSGLVAVSMDSFIQESMGYFSAAINALRSFSAGYASEPRL